MKVLVLGAGGMLGHVLVNLLARRFSIVAASRAQLPARVLPETVTRVTGVVAEELGTVLDALRRHRPAVVLNGVGLIKQRELASDPIASIAVNALFPHQLARACGETGARLVHFSTDCVFSGRRGHHTERDEPDPVDLYGRTKHLGEVTGPRCLTLRTSFIGPELTGRWSLFEWLRARRGGRVTGYQGAIYSGLTTTALGDVVARVLSHHPDLEGVWHVAGPRIDKHALLVALRDAFAIDVAVDHVPEPRIDRSLDGGAFAARTGIGVPDWGTMIADLKRFVDDHATLYERAEEPTP